MRSYSGWGGRSGAQTPDSAGVKLQAGSGAGSRTGHGKWGNKSAIFGGRQRPASSMGFQAVCKQTGTRQNVDILVVHGDTIDPRQHLWTPSSKGPEGSLVKGLTIRPQTSSFRASPPLVRTANRPMSPCNPFFMTSVRAEDSDYLNLEHIAQRLSRSPSPVDERSRKRKGILEFDHIQQQKKREGGSDELKRSREQRVSDAIAAAQLGPQGMPHNPALRGILSRKDMPQSPVKIQIDERPSASEELARREERKEVLQGLPEDLQSMQARRILSVKQGSHLDKVEGSMPTSAAVLNIPSSSNSAMLNGSPLSPHDKNLNVAQKSRPRSVMLPSETKHSNTSEQYTTHQDEASQDGRYHSNPIAAPIIGVAPPFHEEKLRGQSPASPKIKAKAESQDVRNLEATMSQKARSLQETAYLNFRKTIPTRTPQYYVERDLKESILKSCPYTRFLSNKQASIVACECQILDLKVGEVIVREHDTCMCMYILSHGEVAEYKGFRDPSTVRTVDPVTMARYRGDVYSAIQPILANSKELVRDIAEVLLLSEVIAPLQGPSSNHAQIYNVANLISAFHEDFARTHPGGSWDLTPRSRVREPRTADKGFDIQPPDDRAEEETQPCVGRKDGVLQPFKKRMNIRYKEVELPENGHLSPRFLERDRFNRGGVVAMRLSRRPLAEAMAKRASGVPRLSEEQENWKVQASVVEAPSVKRPGTAPAPVHTILSSHGTTQEALAELEKAKDMHVPVQTKIGRNIRRHIEIASAIKSIKAPYQCQLSHDPKKAQLLQQLQMEPALATQPTAYMCGRDQRMKEENESKDEARKKLEHRAHRSFECETRQTFRTSDVKAMIQHPQYHSQRDTLATKKEVAAQTALELNDKKLMCRFTNEFSDFPLKPTIQMYREGKYRMMKEVGMIGSPAITDVTEDTSTAVDSEDPSKTVGVEIKEKEEKASWNTTLRASDTSGLVSRGETAMTKPTFACALRTESPYHHQDGLLVTKDSHAFGDIVGNNPEALQCPQSTLQEAMEQSVVLGQSNKEGVMGHREPMRTWTHHIRYEPQNNEMFSVMSAPNYRRKALKGERRTWDGASATFQVAEVDEVGKPMVADPIPSRTRQVDLPNEHLA